MDNKYLNEVLDRLENYQKMMRQIELLQYEIQYASHVTPTVFFGGRKTKRETSFKIMPPRYPRRHCITRRAVVQ